MKSGSEAIEVNFEELARLLERARQGPLGEEDCQRLEAAIQALSYLIEKIGEKDTTISRLRALLAKPSTEKTSKVLEQAGIKTSLQNSLPPPASEPEKLKPGHGRNPPHPDCARLPQAGRPLSPVLKRQGLRTEGTGLAHPSGGAGALGGHGV